MGVNSGGCLPTLGTVDWTVSFFDSRDLIHLLSMTVANACMQAMRVLVDNLCGLWDEIDVTETMES